MSGSRSPSAPATAAPALPESASRGAAPPMASSARPAAAGGPALVAAGNSRGHRTTNSPPSYRRDTFTITTSAVTRKAAPLSIAVLAVAVLSLLALFSPTAAAQERELQQAVAGTCLNSSKVADPQATLNRLEPPPGYKPIFGFGLDWLNDSTTKIDARLGRRPAVIGGWVKIFPNQSWEDWNLYKMAVGVANAPRPPGSAPPMLMVALMPEITFRGNPRPINVSTFHNISRNLARVNYEYGVPVLLRFCHEMNGPWSAYGQQPVDFVRVWREFVPILRSYTNMTAMLWAPNIGESYPYAETQMRTNISDPNSRAMDTNRDGIIDPSDDPYTPYWPGADVVDWVGISSYYQGGPVEALNSLPPPDRFNEAIMGNFTWNPILYNFHDMFALRYNKPMSVPETGARYYLGNVTGNDTEVAVKRNWWMQVFNATTSGRWTQLKMLAWFEEAKLEGGVPVDYTISWDPVVRRAMLRDMPYAMMQWADNMTYSCDGRILEVESQGEEQMGPLTWRYPDPLMDIPEEVVWPDHEVRPTFPTPSKTAAPPTASVVPTATRSQSATRTAASLTVVSGTIVPVTSPPCTRNCPASGGIKGARECGFVLAAGVAAVVALVA